MFGRIPYVRRVVYEHQATRPLTIPRIRVRPPRAPTGKIASFNGVTADAGVVACLVVSGDVPARHAGFALDTPHCYQASECFFCSKDKEEWFTSAIELGLDADSHHLCMRELLHMLDHFPLVHLRHRRPYRLTGNDTRSLAVGVQENVEDVLR